MTAVGGGDVEVAAKPAPETAPDQNAKESEGAKKKDEKLPWRARVLLRWMAFETPGSIEKSLSGELIKRDLKRLSIGIVVLFLILIGGRALLRGTGSQQPKAPTAKEKELQEREEQAAQNVGGAENTSAVIHWGPGQGLSLNGRSLSASHRAVGTLIKAKTLNSIETYETAPVHAQIMDYGLGASSYGLSLIGDATANETYDRIKIVFRILKGRTDQSPAQRLSARALSMDGTLGLEAEKREDLERRTGISTEQGAVSGLSQTVTTKLDLGSILLRALVQGFQGEITPDLAVTHARAVVLSLKPGTEFFAELTEDFPIDEKKGQ